jgi:hypothetical protein
MIGASLNCRGVGKKGMSTFLQDLIKEQSLILLGYRKQLRRTTLKLFSEELTRLINFAGSGLLPLEDLVESWVVSDCLDLMFVPPSAAGFLSK